MNWVPDDTEQGINYKGGAVATAGLDEFPVSSEFCKL